MGGKRVSGTTKLHKSNNSQKKNENKQEGKFKSLEPKFFFVIRRRSLSDIATCHVSSLSVLIELKHFQFFGTSRGDDEIGSNYNRVKNGVWIASD